MQKSYPYLSKIFDVLRGLCYRDDGKFAGMSISTYAETVKVMDEASTDGSFTIAQTNGQERRDTRQDCRQGEGAVGADKRNCKQQGRQN